MKRSQVELQKLPPPSVIENEQDDMRLDLLIRQLLRNWLINIDIPPNIRSNVLLRSKKGHNTYADKELKMWRNDWDLLYRMQHEHHLELLQEAELSRFLQTSKVFIPKRLALHKRFLSWIGRLMIALGTNLIKRFEPVPSDLSAGTTGA